jgi:hypothetical protein
MKRFHLGFFARPGHMGVGSVDFQEDIAVFS